MNYVVKLTEEELTYICTLITGKIIRKYFQKSSREFTQIRPGFRPNMISDEEAIVLAVRYKSKPFVFSFLNKHIHEWVDEINNHKSVLIKEGRSPETALLLTLPETVFFEQLDIYFKLVEESYSQEYIQLAKSAVQLLSVKPEISSSAIEEQVGNRNFSAITEQLNMAKKDWEVSEKKYIHDIEVLKTTIEEKQQALDATQEKLAIIQAKGTDLETEITELHKLEKSSVFSDKMVRNEEYPFTSLCMVFFDHEGRVRLNRLSDIKDGVILDGYMLDTPVYNRLYTKDSPSIEGFVGIWDWTVIPNASDSAKGYIQSAYNDKYAPVEIVVFRECGTMNELLEQLKQGIPSVITAKKLIFAYWNEQEGYEGIFCTPKCLDTSENKTKLKDNVFSLPLFVFTDADMFAVNERFFHRLINIGMPRKIVRVKDPLEVVKIIIVNRVTWATLKQKGFTRSEYQQFRGLLYELPTDNLYQEVADACDCGVMEAKKLVEQFIQSADTYLSGTDVEGEVLSTLVQNHPTLMERCKNILTHEWQTENSSQISEANIALKAIQKKVSEQTRMSEQINEECVSTQKKLEEALAGLAQQEQIADDVAKKVTVRIEQARQNAADFITEMAFNQPLGGGTVVTPQSVISSATFTTGTTLPTEELDLNNNWSELQDTLKYELLEAGVSEKYVAGLASYMFAAYVNRMPLLLAGPCAHEIADAFSGALFGRLAATLSFDGDYSISIIEQCHASEDSVIVIENPFNNTWNRYLTSILSDRSKLYVVVNPYSEDLLIEPNSILNYMMPLLTELFVDRLPSRNFVGGYMSKEFVGYNRTEIKSYYAKLFTNMRVGPFARKQIQQVLTDMHIILQDENVDYDCIFALLPYAYICEKTDILREQFLEADQKKIAVSADLIASINAYLGEI